MGRQDHQRYEFVLHKKRDKQLIAHISAVLMNGYSLADYVKDLIENDLNPQPAVAAAQPGVSDEQRAFFSEMLDRLNGNDAPLPQMQAARHEHSTGQGAEIQSGGIDMSRPRKRPARPKALEGVTFTADHLPKTQTPQ